MKTLNSSSFRDWIKIVVVLIISFLILAISSFFINLNITNHISTTMEDEAHNEIKSLVIDEVKSQHDKISYRLQQIQNKEKKIIKTKIQSLVTSFQQIPNLMSLSLEERQSLFTEYLNRIDEVDSEYLYFALNTNGNMFRSGTDSKYNGSYVADFTDVDGIKYFAEGLKAVDETEGLYVTYHWPKEKDGIPLRKTSYFLYIPEVEVVVATGNYDEDVEETLRKSTFEDLNSYYQKSSFYIFVVDYSGNVIVHQDKSLIGRNILLFNTGQYAKIHETAMKMIQDSGSGMISYSFNLSGENSDDQKNAYVKSLDQWEVYMGMSYYLSNIESEINENNDYFLKMHFFQIILIVIILLLTCITAYIYLKKAMVNQKKQLKEEELVFTELFQISNEGIVIVSKKGNILYSNKKAKILLKEKEEASIDNKGKFILEEIQDGIYIVRSGDGRISYFSYKMKPFKYLSNSSYIYFLHDETENYLKTKHLKKEAMYDPLTNAANRRKFNEDVNNIFLHSEVDSIELGIIDIDYFKSINDTFGHDVGDKILQLLVNCFKNRLRDTDRIYRYGGDEFVVIIKHTSLMQAEKIISEVIKKYKIESEIILGKPSTLSMGLIDVNLENKDSTVDDYLKLADDLLYKAKQQGRNQLLTNNSINLK